MPKQGTAIKKKAVSDDELFSMGAKAFNLYVAQELGVKKNTPKDRELRLLKRRYRQRNYGRKARAAQGAP